MREAGLCVHRVKIKRRGRAGARINEQRQFAPDQIERMFDVELKIFEQFNMRCQAGIFQPFSQSTVDCRPERVVAAAGIAPAEHERGCAHARRSEPSADFNT